MPWTYRHASAEWQRFLDVAKDELILVSDNAAYTAIQGVLLTFRCRLTIDQALRFGDALPSVPRAIFVMGWHPSAPVPWGSRDEQTAEAQALRPHHNLTDAPDVLELFLVSEVREDDRLAAARTQKQIGVATKEAGEISHVDRVGNQKVAQPRFSSRRNKSA